MKVGKTENKLLGIKNSVILPLRKNLLSTEEMDLNPTSETTRPLLKNKQTLLSTIEKNLKNTLSSMTNKTNGVLMNKFLMMLRLLLEMLKEIFFLN